MTDELKSMIDRQLPDDNLSEQIDKHKAELEMQKRKEFLKKQSKRH
jgi:hypothetical protein